MTTLTIITGNQVSRNLASLKAIERERAHVLMAELAGQDACALNMLYWDFLMRNEEVLGDNPCMRMMYRNVERLKPADKAAITRRARWLKENVEAL